MIKSIELLAPGGDVDCIKAAIAAGADAVYCGLGRFNARNRAENIDLEDLNGILRLAHKHDCKVFIALNILILESEVPALVDLLNRLANTNIDGVIVQDLGLLFLLKHYFRKLTVHASTQLTTHNRGQLGFLAEWGVGRVNLARELSCNEIGELTSAAREYAMESEVFVHGSYCICFSGICYMSSVLGGNSGNRGRCSQPCRDRFMTTPAGMNFPLNLKDNSAYGDLKELAEAGVDAIKIEGRVKGFHYVYTVVNAWRKQLRDSYAGNRLKGDDEDLYKVFNRGFSNGFLKGNIGKSMFTDNPRNHAADFLRETNGRSDDASKREAHEQKERIVAAVKGDIDSLSIAKAPLTMLLSGTAGKPLKIAVTTPDMSFTVLSDSDLITASGKGRSTGANLDYESLSRRFRAIDDTEYSIAHIGLEELESNLFVPFRELTSLKRSILSRITGRPGSPAQVSLPVLENERDRGVRPTLSVLISSVADLALCNETSANIYFQLPDSLQDSISWWVDLFTANDRLRPWFPSVLISEDYTAAVEFLDRLRPELILTNNTGIAHEAAKKGIAWIAGPYLNIVNSYSLLCLNEMPNCTGAFISNEISKDQIRSIRRPQGFKLLYSIYHPILLMTSRQCLSHQTAGCGKEEIDQDCMQTCEKLSAITKDDGTSLIIKKSPGCYHRIYHHRHFLDPDIVSDIPGLFSSFMVDVRDIETEIETDRSKADLIRLFEQHLNGAAESGMKLRQACRAGTDNRELK